MIESSLIMSSVTAMLPQLSFQDTWLSIMGVAFAIYAYFKRYESVDIPVHFVLLVIVPALASTLMAQHLPVFQAIVATFSLIYSVILTTMVIYRVSPFHPLDKYPGPIHLKISKLCFTWVASTGKQHIYISQLHDRYGDAVRIGPNEISFRDVSVIVPAIGATGFGKGPYWQGRQADFSMPPLIALPDTGLHAQRRKRWNRAFNSAALKEYEEIIAMRASDLLELLSVKTEKDIVDLNQWFGWFSFDFMSDMAFGGGSEMMRENDKDHFWKVFESGLRRTHVLGHIPWLSRYVFKLPGAIVDVNGMRNYAIKRGTIRIKSGSTRKDLFHHLNDESGVESSTPPPFREVVSDAVLAMIAGSDTTSGALSTAFFCLLRHPEMYKRLQAEIDKYYPPEANALDTKYHADMPYLNAIINETLRLYPSLPSGSQRKNRSSDGRAVGNYYLPPNTAFLIHIWSIQRNPRNFSPAPRSFFPDRWLIASGESKYTGNEPFVHDLNAFIPFSFGPANCVGKNLAMQEMRMVICLLMQKLNFRFADNWNPNEYDHGLCDFLVSVREKLPVIITPRKA